MDQTYMGFDIGKVVIELLKHLNKKGILEEDKVLDILWEAKDPQFPWSKQDIKDLIKL